MDINEICRRGYFDKVAVNVMIEPIYGEDIEVYSDRTFEECIGNMYNLLDTTVFKIRVSILGVDCIKKQALNSDELSKLSSRGVKVYKESGKGNRVSRSYLLAYMDLIIIKDIERNKRIVEQKFSVESDKSILLDVAFSLQGGKKVQNSAKIINNIAIVDRLYVYDKYRRCGISTWLLENLRDIVLNYGRVSVGDILLIPGDFANEAGEKFNMNSQAYSLMLTRHYQSVGYRRYGNGLMINKGTKMSIKDSAVKVTMGIKEKILSLKGIAFNLMEKSK